MCTSVDFSSCIVLPVTVALALNGHFKSLWVIRMLRGKVRRIFSNKTFLMRQGMQSRFVSISTAFSWYLNFPRYADESQSKFSLKSWIVSANRTKPTRQSWQRGAIGFQVFASINGCSSIFGRTSARKNAFKFSTIAAQALYGKVIDNN